MLTAFLLIFHLGISSAQEIPQPPRQGVFGFGFAGGMLSSDENYGESGEPAGFGGKYKETSLRPSLEWDFSSETRLYGAMDYLSVESSGSPGASSGSGLSAFSAGAQYWMLLGALRFVPQIDAIFPTYRVDTTANDALIGEGAMEIQGGAWLQWQVASALTAYGYLGFRYRDEGRAFLLPFDVGAHYTLPSGNPFLQLGVRGYQPVTDDSDIENRSDRNLFLTRANGGSFRYYQINPSMMELHGDLGYYSESRAWRISAGAATTIAGESSAKYLSFNGGLTYYWGADGAHEEAVRSRFRSEDEAQTIEREADPTPEKQFSTPEPKYDESLFKDEVQAGKPPVEKIAKPKAKPAVKPKPAVKAKPKTMPTVQLIKKQRKKKLDKAIEDAERALEKRK